MKIGVMLDLSGQPGELTADARALESAGADSFWVAPGADQLVLLAAIGAVTWRARLVPVDVSPGEALDTLERLAPARVATAMVRGDEIETEGGDAGPERWARAEFPSGKAAWREFRAAQAAQGIAGLVLRNDPRLLDLLRNPDVEDDRQDQKLAFG